MNPPTVTVIIPTRGLSERGDLLWRAVESVRGQEGVGAIALVVLNGARRDVNVEGALRRAEGVRLVVRETDSLPGALHAGRMAVESPWFGTLDDDDVLLPGALATRLAVLTTDPGCDVVVTNGVVRRDGVDTLHISSEVDVGRDPLRALLGCNWMLPGSWLARSATVGPALFADIPRYRECTYLALRFAMDCAMRWLAEPTVVYHVGSPHAESTSNGYLMEQVKALHQILALELPPAVRRRLRREVTGAMHEMADHEWSVGKLREAWGLHARTLASYRGLHYLPFTRHLVRDSLRALVRPGKAASG